MNVDEIEQKVKDAAATLMEHCDTVQIFVTIHDVEVTHAYQTGRGNYYARLGQIQEWLTREDESSRDDQRTHED